MKRAIPLFLFLSLIIASITAQTITTQVTDNYQFNKDIVDKLLKSYVIFKADMTGVGALQTGINDQIQQLEFQFNVGQFHTTFYLHNSGIITPRYKRVTSSGRKITSPSPSPMEGYTTEGLPTRITVNTDYLHGFIQTEETRYYIDPLWKFDEDAAPGLYVLYDMYDAIQQQEATCGIDAQAPQHINPPVEIRSPVSNCYEVEYALASDYSMYQKYGSVTNVENQILSVSNDMETNYDNEFNDQLDYVIVETYIVDCSGCDPWTSSTNAGTLLSDFRNWGNNGGFTAFYDDASLWTDRDFDGSTVGIAWINGLCNNSRYNCLQDFSTDSEALRVVNSHELGHNWGAHHDPSGSPYIMAPAVNITNNWSSTSENAINSRIASSNGGTCLESCTTPSIPQAGFSADYTQVCDGSAVQFFEEVTGGQVDTYSWTFNGGNPSSSSQANPIVKYPNPGTYTVKLMVTGPDGSTSETKSGYIQVGSGGVDVFEFFTFESGMENWTIKDGGNNGSFSRTSVNGTLGNQALFIDNFNAPSQSYDALISPTLNFAGRTQVFMQLDYAVAGNASSNDSLIVYVSNDNGNTYQRVFSITEDGSENYITAHSSGSFVPQDSTDWCINHAGRGHSCLHVDLSSVAGYGDVKVKIEQYHEAGNNLYIDKIAFRSDCYQLQAPVADFTTDMTTGCVPVTMQFTDQSSQNPTSWNWVFPGGTPNSSTLENPTVTYQVAGTYDVYLTVGNGAGNDQEQKIGYINVDDVPIADFTYSQSGLTVTFINNSIGALQYLWDFGDGNGSSQENPTHTYSAPGVYTVILTASNICGDDVITQDIILIVAPTAGFSAYPTTLCEGNTVQFIDESSYAVTYEWRFEGGTPATSTASSPIITYNQAGVYDVTQIVFNSMGSDTLLKADYIVVSPLPVADFSAFANGLLVTLTNLSTNADSYQWDFGDGQTSQQENPVHVYESGGNYTIQLIAINSCGQDTFTQNINLINAPVADFSADKTEGCKPLVVHFTSNSPDATAYNWTFEGGTPASSTQQNVTVTYSNAGSYDVKLEVSNSTGSDILLRQDYIAVKEEPDAIFSASTNGLTVVFNNTSTNASSYSWDFGDGQTSQQENPTHSYSSSGQFIVTLVASNSCGSDTYTVTIGVGDFPSAQFEGSVTEGCIPFQVTFHNLYGGDVNTYRWTFEGGDPATSTQEQPTVTYNSIGSYDVKLIVTNGLGSDTVHLEDYITARDIPVSDFTYTTDGLTVNFNEEISGDYTSLLWIFGDGNTSTADNPSHVYSDYNTYTVKLIASNSCGSDTLEKLIDFSEPATASFDVSQTRGCTPFTVNMANNSTGDNLTYQWIFEGGEPLSSQEKEPVVTYTTPGIYDVTLMVTNSISSDTLVLKNYIEVLAQPVVDFNFTVSGDTVVFNNLSENADSYLWEFGDGEMSTEENPTHIYEDVNGKEVTLTVYNECDTISESVLIDTSIPPVAEINAQSQEVCLGASVTYNDVSQGVVNARKWIFEGGTPATSTLQNPTVRYNATGRYDITLIVSNSVGSDTIYKKDFITVIDVPVAQFDYEINGDTVQFIQQSVFADEFRWDFGNGILQNGSSPVIAYEAEGKYTIQLIAMNQCGADTITKTIEIITATEEIPQSAFKVYPNPFYNQINIEFSDELSGEVFIRLYNMTGQLVKENQVSVNYRRITSLNVSNLTPGLYLLEIQQEGKVAYRKLIGQ